MLIHEATFETELEEHARQKRHSTVAEALDVAEHMEAYRVILTHFSQRYPKVPQIETDKWASARVAVAFDHMTVGLQMLPWLPFLLHPIQAVLNAPKESSIDPVTLDAKTQPASSDVSDDARENVEHVIVSVVQDT